MSVPRILSLVRELCPTRTSTSGMASVNSLIYALGVSFEASYELAYLTLLVLTELIFCFYEERKIPFMIQR